jgi:chaperonin GroEL
MAGMLAEIFDIVGPDGLIVIEAGQRGQLEREYVDGTYWHLSGWLSRWFVTDKAEMRATFEDAALLITDLSLKDPQQLVPVLNQCAQAGIGKLVILAKEMSDSVVGLLVTNNEAKTIQSMAVRAPKAGADLVAALEDMAVLTGGRVFYSAGKEALEDFRLDDLGHARRIWATLSLFGIFGGKGDPRKVRQHMSQLRGILRLAESKNDKKNTQERLGRLSGSTAILRVGGVTPSEIEVRKTMAQRAVTALRNAFRDGMVPGGGAALLSAQAALQGPPPEQVEAAAARKILARALEEPMRVIARNAGAIPDVIIEKARTGPKGYGFDSRSCQIVDMRQAGIVDSVRVLKTALEIAVSGAAMALTTDVIVHHSLPKESIDP